MPGAGLLSVGCGCLIGCLNGWLVAGLLVLLAFPYLLAVIYRFVDPVSTLMIWRSVKGAPVVRTWVPMDQIAPVLPLTVIGSEDKLDVDHFHVNYWMRRALGRDADHEQREHPRLQPSRGPQHGHHLAHDEKNHPPLANVLLTVIQKMGVATGKFQDAKGTLTGLV